MTAQAYLFPDQEIAQLQISLERTRKRLFIENGQLKKDIAELEAHVETLTWAVQSLMANKDPSPIPPL